jgi:uncharacterized protein (DUF952 family)/catechol 2,3-dioxygenase-like lactoylglutathione lyase family enzyme
VTRWLYHLALADDWQRAIPTGEYRISTRGRTLEDEGFIHLSTLQQVSGVADRYYADVRADVLLLTVDVTLLDADIRLEVPTGADEAYPHLYGPLPIGTVVAVRRLDDTSPETRLHHAHIFASDIDATIEFWTSRLGATVAADEILLGSRNVMLMVGSGRLNVYDQPPRSAERGPVHHLGIQVRHLDALVDHMTALGTEFRKPVTAGEGFRYVMAEAPDGILLELFEADETTMPPSARDWFAWGG